MNRKISINIFDKKSIESAIREIEQYRDDLPNKCKEICKRLSEEGITVANAAINSVSIGRTIVLTTDISPEKMGCKAIMRMTGKDTRLEDGRVFMTHLAIEFGAGIRYNPTSNPKAKEFGLGVGTFPDQKHAFDSKGWYYLGDDGEWHHSYGVQATMPMYKASLEIRKKLYSVSKEVFG